jgi:hypothetical protein
MAAEGEDGALVTFDTLSKNGPSLTLVIKSPFIPLTGSEPCSHGGHGLYPSFFSHLTGFSGASFVFPPSVVYISSTFDFLYFQNPDPL